MKEYRGTPEINDTDMAGDVFVSETADPPFGRTRRKLDPRFDLRNHSPTGFAWGYNGSGPAQLALAILADATDDDTAQQNYQPYKEEVIAHLKPGAWTITLEEVREWLTPKEDRGDDFMETLPDVCSNLYPHAVIWRACVYSSNVVKGVVQGQENRDEIEVLDQFISVCRQLGLGESP